MGLFSRRRSGSADGTAQIRAIADFWGWWQEGGAAEVAAAIEQGHPGELAGSIASRVERIDRRLGWELGPGSSGSKHLMVLSAEGDPAVRAAARRWLLAAPADDETWSYADARQPLTDLGDATLVVDGAEVAVQAAVVAAGVRGAQVDVCVHHPAFAGLPEQQRLKVAFLMLDWVLGENEVAAWVGEIATTTVTPLGPVPIAGLRSVVAELRRQNTDQDGAPGWVLMQGETAEGAPLIATAQVPLRSVTAPQLDTYAQVAVPFTDRSEAGLPGLGSLDALRDLEEHLDTRLGASGRIVAHQTSAGVRVLHVYLDGTTPAVEQLKAAVTGWSQGRVEIRSEPDASWQRVAHLRG